mgnify:CR=1 FL=1
MAVITAGWPLVTASMAARRRKLQLDSVEEILNALLEHEADEVVVKFRS